MSPAQQVKKPKALECPGCGGSVEMRGFGRAITATCVQCLRVIDTSSAEMKVVAQYSEKSRVPSRIPLGKRGTLDGATWEAIGFQQRYITVDGTNYFWEEYVLFNPYLGFRYLTFYDGHWTFVHTLQQLPHGGTSTATWNGQKFKHFQRSSARTAFVLGEFPWRVNVGEVNTVNDYVAPPWMLSSEETAGEIVWSASRYVTGAEVWQAFQLPGEPPPANGVYANQPTPFAGKTGSMWRTFLLLAGLMILVGFATRFLAPSRTVFEHIYTFNPAASGESAFVTPAFELPGGGGGVEIRTTTDLTNQWMGLGIALINDATGQGYDLGRTISYYSGVDSDGRWTEGSQSDSARLASVPPGKYYLRVEPEWESEPGQPSAKSVIYQISVSRNAPRWWPFIVGVFLLPIPLIFQAIRAFSFEVKRWSESDHPMVTSSDD